MPVGVGVAVNVGVNVGVEVAVDVGVKIKVGVVVDVRNAVMVGGGVYVSEAFGVVSDIVVAVFLNGVTVESAKAKLRRLFGWNISTTTIVTKINRPKIFRVFWIS